QLSRRRNRNLVRLQFLLKRTFSVARSADGRVDRLIEEWVPIHRDSVVRPPSQSHQLAPVVVTAAYQVRGAHGNSQDR
ncbi:MAG: hypothetical protein QOJ75_1979, partial [Chloroflexota bacterium]|nr:hypothetical protein [Chloroflexota bacterium]